jgi:ferric iron reductase protein FhuF
VILSDDGASDEADPTDPFSRLFDHHVEPLIRHFAGHFRVSPRLLWGNAATIFDWTIQQAAAFDGVRPDALDVSRIQLESRIDRKGRANPMFGAVQRCEQDGQTIPRRKVCCLRYLLPGMQDCGSLCPVPLRSR